MILLTIAGFDPCGGAGVLLDTAVFRALGFEGAAVLTAVTVQNTSAVFGVKPLPSRFIRDQARALDRDLTFAGIKVGMAGSVANLLEIGCYLAEHPDIPRIVDPVVWASSGRRLSGTASRRSIFNALRGNASVLTPNLAEASFLSGRPVRTFQEMQDAAEIIHERSGIPCLIKGGHLPGDPVNVLFDGRRHVRFAKKRIPRDVHGTGCLFSAALLGFLVQTGDLEDAADSATDWTHKALRSAAPIGRGRAIFSPLSLPRL